MFSFLNHTVHVLSARFFLQSDISTIPIITSSESRLVSEDLQPVLFDQVLVRSTYMSRRQHN